MQYYGIISKRRAGVMLFMMFIDPLIYNAIFYYFIKYLWLVPLDQGGCCVVPTSVSVLTFFFIMFILVHLASSAIISYQIFACLTSDPVTYRRSKLALLIIFIATFMNMHLFLFGFCPCLHRHFAT